MLPCLVPVLFASYLEDVLKFKCKIPASKVEVGNLKKSIKSHVTILKIMNIIYNKSSSSYFPKPL